MPNQQNLRLWLFVFGLILASISGYSIATLPIGQAIEKTANRLEANQIKTGVNKGIWPQEALFTGSIVAGMVSAYELMCDPNYKTSAELGGDYIILSAQGNYYGDEAYALMRLSDIASDPCNNIWRTTLSNFYFNVEHGDGGTEGYISEFGSIDPSTAVFYIANYVAAAYYIDANDRLIWRQGLIDYLSKVDDNSSYFPVLALGVATWALARTGPLDNTLIDPSGVGAPYWSGKRLKDLPGLLCSHQVPKPESYADSFYWRFDHTNGGSGGEVSGYTEDAIFASLGLIAASGADPNLNLDANIIAAREALLSGVGADGTVWEHLSGTGTIYYAYAGEMLHVLSEFVISGWTPWPYIYDLDDDDFIGPGDLSLFACCWLHPATDSGCSGLLPCVDGDFDCDGFVGPGDLSWFATGWLKSCADPTILYPPCQSKGKTCGMATSQALASSTPASDVQVCLAILTSPSPSDTMETLPSSVSSVSLGRDYYIEVWASDVGQINTGLTSVYVDVIFTPFSAVSAQSISHGGLFTVFPSGTIGYGLIDELGGSCLIGPGIEPQWARVAIVKMHAEASGTISCDLAHSITGIASLGRGLISWSDVDLCGSGILPVCGSPDYPYPTSDLNHDCYVSWLDMRVVALHWLETGCADTERCAGADLDLSGSVDLSDFSFLATHWLECSLPVCD